MPLSDFIPTDAQQRIAECITEAERHTSGEICVHVTPTCKRDPLKRAIKTFNRLKLYQTRRRNAVLIYVAYESRKFAIIGDVGINKVVDDSFWDNERDALGKMLLAGRPVDGICDAVTRLGEKLSAFFPADRTDENELSNEVSFDDIDDED